MNNALLESERITLLDLLDRLLETGVVAEGEVDLSVADIDLIHLGVKLVLASSATLERHSNDDRNQCVDPTHRGLDGLPGDCSTGSAICQSSPIPTEAVAQEGAHSQPTCAAETAPRSLPATERGKHGARLCPGIDQPEGTRGLAAGAADKALSNTGLGRGLAAAGRIKQSDFESAKLEHGLAKLVLTLVELLRRLMEKQAVRKMEGGTLTAPQVERLGEAFRRLEGKMEELKCIFGLRDEELNLDLGPLGAMM